MTTLLSNLVALPKGFKPSVQLPNDFYDATINSDLLAKFIATRQSVELLGEVARSMNPNSTDRVRMLHGTYGTGKSDLLLILANYFSRPVDDSVLQPLYASIKKVNEGLFETIRAQRAERKPFLVVLLQADSEKPFPGFVLHGLQQALEQANLLHLMSETKYAAATQRIRDWQTSHPEVLARFERLLREREAKELDGLLAELSGGGADYAFRAFQRTFRDATGTEFNVFEYDQPHVTYKQVARALVQQGTHSGILIIIDEFTEMLRRFGKVSDAQSEALVLQNLAETASSSAKDQIHFLVAGLEPFSSAAAALGASTVTSIIERVGGRFKPYALQVQGSEELLQGALQRAPGAENIIRLPNRQRDELLTIAEKLWKPRGQPREWIKQVVIEGAFPLHPLATYILPELNQKVAQSQRTMFLFLNDPLGLPMFLGMTPLVSDYNSWHNLLTLDVLFDYFRESIAARFEEIVGAYDLAQMHLSAATVDTTLAIRALKVIALCEVAPAILSPTLPIIRQALNLPEEAEDGLSRALQALDSLNAVYVPGEPGGAYALLLSDRVNPSKMRRLLNIKSAELANRITADTLNEYQNTQAQAVGAGEYNISRGSERVLKSVFVAPASLGDDVRARRALDWAGPLDGALLYVITDSETERQEALSSARKLTAPQTMQRLVIAVPEKATDILTRLRNYRALQEARNDPSLSEREREYLSDRSRIGLELYQTFKQERDRLDRPEAWVWVVGGEIQSVSRGGAQQIASRVMERAFPDTPAHGSAQHLKPEKFGAPLTRAVEELLKGTFRAPFGNKQEWYVIRKGAAQMGLLHLDKSDSDYEYFTVMAPDGKDQASWRVWHKFEQLEKDLSWTKLLDDLRRSPFGLYDSLIMLFSACFFARRADELTITRGAVRITPTAKTLEDLLTNPRGVQVRLQPLNERERRWLHAVIERGLRKKLDSAGSGAPLRDRVAAQVRQWYISLRLPPFIEQLDTDDLGRYLPDERPEVISAIHLLLKGVKSSGDLAGMLLDELPATLGMPPRHALWEDQQVDEAISAVHETFQALERLPGRVETHALHEVAKVFGATYENAEQNWNAIYHWRGTRNAVSPSGLPSEPRTLFRMINDPNGTLKTALLNDFAASVVPAIGAYDEWSSLTKLDVLVERLTKAVHIINEHWLRNAPQEQVWLDRVAQAALGRNSTELKPEKVAAALANWAGALEWPACADQLSSTHLQTLYPERNANQVADIAHLLLRHSYSAAQWEQDLSQALAADFGAAGWSRPAVESAIRRFTQALADAGEFNERLRRYILRQASAAFSGREDDPRSVEEIVRTWRANHQIPQENDLSEDAQILLRNIDESTVVDTLLTERLPRAYPTISAPYRQWQGYRELADYLAIIAGVVAEINTYQPLAPAEAIWLQEILSVIGRPLVRPARERSRLVRQTLDAVRAWRTGLNLPAFACSITPDELNELTADTPSWSISAAWTLLSLGADNTDASRMLLNVLPSALEVETPPEHWGEDEMHILCERFAQSTALVAGLNEILISRLVCEIDAVFGGDGTGATPIATARRMREWRREYVLLGTQPLSDPARVLSDRLQSTEDPTELLLRRLPHRIGELRAPYEGWSTWRERTGYLRALDEAAREIERVGSIGKASVRAGALWEQIRTEMAELSDDDRRWLIKQFDDSFRL